MQPNFHRNFLNSCAVATGSSDRHKRSVTFLKTYLKIEHKRVTYREYKNYSNYIFRELVFSEFAKLQVRRETPAL